MSIRELLEESCSNLKAAGITDKMDIYILLEMVFHLSRAEYFVHCNESAKEEQIAEFRRLVSLRMKRIPLQYITGHQEFMGLDFQVNENVLVPRQDTENVVEVAINMLKDMKNPKVLDMCTGSGCIAISIDKAVVKSTVYGADISDKALEIAIKNNEINKANVNFIESNLFEHIVGSFDMIISNPPYIRTNDIDKLEMEVSVYEPRLALDGYSDGLYFYKKITEASTKYLAKNGYLIYEIGYDQATDVTKIMQKNGFSNICVIKDFCGNNRCIYGIYK